MNERGDVLEEHKPNIDILIIKKALTNDSERNKRIYKFIIELGK